MWLQRPKGVTGPKLEHWWTGTYRVHARTGQSSYALTLGPNQLQDAHADQLKPCTWDINLGESYPLVWRKSKDPLAQSSNFAPCSITAHRYADETGWEFLTTRTASPDATATWEPASKVFRDCDETWMR